MHICMLLYEVTSNIFFISEQRWRFSIMSILKTLDAKTRRYFNQTRNEQNAADRKSQSSHDAREDLKRAFNSEIGRKLRIKFDDCHMNDKEKRALAMCALWANWKQKQLGHAIKIDEIPAHCLPVLKI